jgi:hypothetical protein
MLLSELALTSLDDVALDRLALVSPTMCRPCAALIYLRGYYIA